jgi:CheY-like chemotaxis protein
MARILWIEDDLSQFQVIVQLLECDGHSVIAAASLTEAEKILRDAAPFDMVIVDNYVAGRCLVDNRDGGTERDYGAQFVLELARKGFVMRAVVLLTFFIPKPELVREIKVLVPGFLVIDKNGQEFGPLEERLRSIAGEVDS